VHDGVGSFMICPVCGWEDDPVQLRWPGYEGGANRSSLLQAQSNFQRFGASEEKWMPRLRAAREDEPREPGFRFADPEVDDLEPLGHRGEWPRDMAALYWWRRSFWRG
jgi:hypothetical protein